MNETSQFKIWMGAAGIFVALALIVVFALSSVTQPEPEDDAAIIAGQKEAIGDIVRDYLLDHPEVVRDSLIELERREQVAQSEQQKQAIVENREQIFHSPDDFVAGNPNGDVTLVEYFDYNCGFCRRAVADLNRLLEDDPNLRVVLKEFPVLNQGSIEAARLSMAAIKQGKYMAFHRALFEVEGGVDAQQALRVAAELGMDVDEMTQYASDNARVDVISANLRIASQLGINGTPSYVIGEQLVVGAVGYDQLKAVIEEERAKLKAGS